jgi:hypothetical protein
LLKYVRARSTFTLQKEDLVNTVNCQGTSLLFKILFIISEPQGVRLWTVRSAKYPSLCPQTALAVLVPLLQYESLKTETPPRIDLLALNFAVTQMKCSLSPIQWCLWYSISISYQVLLFFIAVKYTSHKISQLAIFMWLLLYTVNTIYLQHFLS